MAEAKSKAPQKVEKPQESPDGTLTTLSQVTVPGTKTVIVNR